MESKSSSYAVIGAGAVGCFFGAALQQTGVNVHFFGHGDISLIQRDGLHIRSPYADIDLPQVKIYNDITKIPKCDVVLLAVKATQMDAVIPDLPKIMLPNSVVVVMQNGIDLERKLEPTIPPQQIIGGIVTCAVHREKRNVIRHTNFGRIVLAEYLPGWTDDGCCMITETLKRITQDFSKTDIITEMHEDLFLKRWEKLLWNIPLNPLSTILNATLGELVENLYSNSLMRDLMRECLNVMLCYGRIIENQDEYIDNILKQFTKAASHYTSMKIDYDNKEPMEIEAILGNALRLAEAKNCPMPKTTAIYELISYLDNKN
ncbi:MAG: 2-dehydropantoate 2-reductase [Gammaproteobacteria bacterium]|nr:2-dehydropantoate 2-reductase [Gammaproteobacteria bacterium]